MNAAGRAVLASAILVLATDARAGLEAGLAQSLSSAAFVSPSTAAYSEASGPVGTIAIHQLQVFDLTKPGENIWLFRLANKIHIQTKPYILRRELLLSPGEPWNPIEAIETERNLRALPFIRNAEIRPRPNHATREVNLDLDVQDSWTTQPQLSVGTEGGDTYFIWGFEEFNVLGYGKTASLYHSQVGDIIRSEARYSDPLLWGTRNILTTLYSTTNKGDEEGVNVGRPFFSLETLYSWNALWANIIKEDTLYQNAATYSKFIENYRSVNPYYAVRLSETSDPVQRLSFGARYEHDYFTPTGDTIAGTLPQERRLSGPTLGYALIQPRYAKETYINTMERVEDFNLGNEFSATAGAMRTEFGSDMNEWTVDALDQQGLGLGKGRFALAQAGVQGRLKGNTAQNAIFYANGNLFWKTWKLFPQTWVAHLEWNTTQNLDGQHQLLLGGNTGLRGYRNYSFAGTRALLLNFEDRAFLMKEFFHLFRAGGVAFFDVGTISGAPGELLTWSDSKSDLGFGLRFMGTRSSSGGVVRMDMAYALNNGPGPSRWVFTLRGGQAFQIFNSANQDVLQTPAAVINEDAGQRLRQH